MPKFVVEGNFNQAKKATVTINRKTNVVTVRPFHRRDTYALPLSDVAEMIMWRVLKADAA